jgi:hypothetical protein
MQAIVYRGARGRRREGSVSLMETTRILRHFTRVAFLTLCSDGLRSV